MKTAIVFAIAALTAAPALAVPQNFGSSWYDSIGFTGTWNQARTDALSQVCAVCGPGVWDGYLVNITTAAENSFIRNNVASGGWIGGTDEAVEGRWVWADGPEAGVNFWNGAAAGSSPTFASWGGGEPNDYRTGEDYAEFSGGTWNDFYNNSTRSNYIVEYTKAAPVPLPAGLPLALTGFAAFGLARRKRR